MRPSSMSTMRSAKRRAKSASWVTMIIVVRDVRTSAAITSSTSRTRIGSKAEVGSSHSMRRGCRASARAMATRWRSPPDSSSGRRWRMSHKPTWVKASRARSRASSGSTRANRNGISTLSKALKRRMRWPS